MSGTAISSPVSLQLLKLSKGFKKFSAIRCKLGHKVFIECKWRAEDSINKLLLMITFQFFKDLIGQYFANPKEIKLGYFCYRKFGLN